MNAREKLCDLFDLPYITDDETLFDCALKYTEDSTEDSDIEIEELEEKNEKLSDDKIDLLYSNKKLQMEYNELSANYKLIAFTFQRYVSGDSDIIDEKVWELPIWEELRKESEE